MNVLLLYHIRFNYNVHVFILYSNIRIHLLKTNGYHHKIRVYSHFPTKNISL